MLILIIFEKKHFYALLDENDMIGKIRTKKRFNEGTKSETEVYSELGGRNFRLFNNTYFVPEISANVFKNKEKEFPIYKSFNNNHCNKIDISFG